jgi:hypothetical protein
VKVTAVGNRGAHLSPIALEKTGTTSLARFGVTIGVTYPIYAMRTFEGVLYILVIGDSGRPNWYLLDLFEGEGTKIPSDWEFCRSSEDRSGCSFASWGYHSLIHNPLHHDALIDREVWALREFLEDCSKVGRAMGDGEKIAALQRIVDSVNS